ncbi:unnamed protein product [Calypogeia fissa]
MANSDIENYTAEFGLSSPRASACTIPGGVRDLKSLLSIARQERAPLESSNTSNCVNNNQALHAAAATKKRQQEQGLNGRRAAAATVGHFSRRPSVDGGRAQPCAELSIDDEDGSRQRQWAMLSPRVDEADDDSTCSLFHNTASAAPAAALDDAEEFDRETVEAAVQDSFRQLCAPREVDRRSHNFFEGIIDVDREVGFGEDEDFEREENGFGSESCKASEFHPTTSCGQCSLEEGREEGHLQSPFRVIVPNSNSRGGDSELTRQQNRKFAYSCLAIESGSRARQGDIEDFMRYASLEEPEFRGGLPNQYLHSSAPEDETHLNSEKELAGENSSVDYEEEPADEEWMPTKSESGDQGMPLGSRETEWEMVRRGVPVEEEQEEGNRADAGQGYPLDSESEDIDEAIEDMLAEMREENSGQEGSEESVGQDEEPERMSLVHAAIRNRSADINGNPYSLIFLGFDDLLREADGRAERERKTLEDVMRVQEETEEVMEQQQMRWSEAEKQMQSRINLLEMQHARLLDILRETEAALTTEKERRKESRTEVDRILDMLKKERKSNKETVEKLGTSVNSLMKLRGNLAVQKSRSSEEGGPSYLQVLDTALEDMDRELQVNLTQWTKKSSEVDDHASDIDELSRWKQQRDALEEERDKVEENMTLLLRRTRERHEEMEVLWLEREALLEQKVGCLEVELQRSEMKQRRKEAEILAERVRWAEELQKHRKAWARERIAWEATVRGKEDWDCIPSASEENCLVLANAANEAPVEYSSGGSESNLEVVEPKELQDVVSNEGSSDLSKSSAGDDQISQFCVDVGQLALVIDAGVEKSTKDLCSRERQWEMERVERKELEESFQKERQDMEKRISDTTASMEMVKMDMAAREAEMEAEKKQIEGLLMQKATEVEKLNFQIKSKEHDMEVTVQKFMDEVRLIDKEVEKERKEREQVMELHFASKRKVVTDMKEREEKWDREIESMKQELGKAKMEIRHKEKEIEELKRSYLRAPSDRERQLTKAVSTLQHEKDALAAELAKEKGEVRRAMDKMFADVWKVCEEDQIQAAMAKRLGPNEELSVQRPVWESLWLEYCKHKGIGDDYKSVEGESAMERIARFEQEMSEATTVIETLRGELKMKEDQLVEAKADTETVLDKIEADWADERENLTKLVEKGKQKEIELFKELQEKEQEFIMEKEAKEKAHKAQQGESAEAISNLQGVVRELEWVLKQSKSPEANHEVESSIVRRGLIQPAVRSTDLVRVHASYLEEVDRYILELEAKMEAAENQLRGPERVTGRKWGGDPEMNLALMRIERELFSTPDSKGHLNSSSPDHERGYFSPHGSRDWDAPGGGLTGTNRKRMPRKRAPRNPERNLCLTLNGLTTLAQDTWAHGAEENLPLWQLEDRNSIASWMSPRSSTEDLYASLELPAHGVLALPSSSPPTPSRRQQKWVVDVGWLEQVRKEHAWLRQQLEIERQRVAALGRVEADNRWIEAAIIRALELKRESDSKVADMERKVNVMEVLMSKNSRCSTP